MKKNSGVGKDIKTNKIDAHQKRESLKVILVGTFFTPDGGLTSGNRLKVKKRQIGTPTFPERPNS